MALRGTLTHRKTRRLARLLSISPSFALGLLEALWHLTAEQFPDGDISSLSAEDIAEELFYEGDPQTLLSALIDSKWIDVYEESALPKADCTRLVRGWSEHADVHINTQLAKRTMLFADGTMPKIHHDSFNERSRARVRAEFAKKYPHLAIEAPEPTPEGPEPTPNGPGPVPDQPRTYSGPDREPPGPYQEPGTRNQEPERGEIPLAGNEARGETPSAPTDPPPPLALLTGRDLASGAVFKPPTLAECIAEGRRWGLSESESTKFWGHYGGTGWRVKGDLLVNWQARMAGWRERQIQFDAERQPAADGTQAVVSVTGVREVID